MKGVKENMFFKIFIGIFLISLAVFFLGGNIFADEEESVVFNEVVGEVSYVSSKYISVVYSKGKGIEKEIMFHLDEELNLVRIRDLKVLNMGDVIKVLYAQIEKDDKVKRVAKQISFIRAKTKPFKLKGLKSSEK